MLNAQVEGFVAVAREGNLRRAAELLYVSQPALTARAGPSKRALIASAPIAMFSPRCRSIWLFTISRKRARRSLHCMSFTST